MPICNSGSCCGKTPRNINSRLISIKINPNRFPPRYGGRNAKGRTVESKSYNISALRENYIPRI